MGDAREIQGAHGKLRARVVNVPTVAAQLDAMYVANALMFQSMAVMRAVDMSKPKARRMVTSRGRNVKLVKG